MASSNGYGAVSTSGNGNGNSIHHRTDEEQPLLGHTGLKYAWRKKLMANVHRDWADVVLLLCYIITGLLDSAAISTWGSFVSMQTGTSHILLLMSILTNSTQEIPCTSD